MVSFMVFKVPINVSVRYRHVKGKRFREAKAMKEIMKGDVRTVCVSGKYNLLNIPELNKQRFR